MALPCCCIFLFLISCLLFSEAQQSSFRPKAFVLPVSKDPSTLQYITLINQRTPLVPVNLTLDLGGQLLWVDCDQGYVSSSYKPARCGSALCSLAKSKSCRTVCYSTPKPGCNNNTCQLLPDNSVTQTIWGLRDLGQDVVSIQSTDGRLVKVPNLPLSCVPTSLLKGLAKGVTAF
ncbi:Probable aspartic proteinase GIP2 [Linum grandiflorum]